MTDITVKAIEAELNENELNEVSGGVAVSDRAAFQDSMVSAFKRSFTREFVVQKAVVNPATHTIRSFR